MQNQTNFQKIDSLFLKKWSIIIIITTTAFSKIFSSQTLETFDDLKILQRWCFVFLKFRYVPWAITFVKIIELSLGFPNFWNYCTLETEDNIIGSQNMSYESSLRLISERVYESTSVIRRWFTQKVQYEKPDVLVTIFGVSVSLRRLQKYSNLPDHV